jgi:helicase
MENYLCADPEKIWSKLSVERVLRPHVLSTIATRFAHTEESLYHFFSRTFHAHQYDLKMLRKKVGRILEFLVKEEMIEIDDGKLSASRFGKRVSELYIDPLSAVIIRDGLYDRPKKLSEISLLQLVAHTPDMAPRLYPRGKESERLTAYSQEHSDELIFKSPEPYSSIVPYEQDYDDFLSELKCVAVIADWIEEFSEDHILDNHKVEPGDLLRLTQTAEWLIYATNELAKLFQHKDLQNTLNNLRTRVQSGIKQELVELVSLEGVGRVRARMLFNSGFRNIGDLKRASLSSLTSIPTIGMSVAKRIKDQVGGKLKVEEWEALKKGYSLDEQKLLTEYDDK